MIKFNYLKTEKEPTLLYQQSQQKLPWNILIYSSRQILGTWAHFDIVAVAYVI